MCPRPSHLCLGPNHICPGTSPPPPPISADELGADVACRRYSKADCTTPIILLLSPGIDPTALLRRFAASQNCSDRIRFVSLGKGQDHVVRHHLEDASWRGHWVILQNCQYSINSLHIVNVALEELQMSGKLGDMPVMDKHFRLWMTTQPTADFPSALTLSCVKLILEAPEGLRAKMHLHFDAILQAYPEVDGNTELMRLLFGLTWFHSLIQERCRFGALGWNIPYHFSEADLLGSVQLLQSEVSSSTELPWKALLCMTGEIMYGGRLTDEWDRTCLLLILERSFNSSLLKQPCRLAKHGTYMVPAGSHKEEFMAYIDSLPTSETPEIFGLHNNADIMFRQLQSDDTHMWLQDLYPSQATLLKKSAATGIVPDSAALSRIVKELQHDFPQDLLRSDGAAAVFGDDMTGRTRPFGSVLLQEMAQYNSLLQEVRSSLQSLSRGISGADMLSEGMLLLTSHLMNNEIPTTWRSASYLTLLPLGAWHRDLIQRTRFLRAWMKKGEPPSFWLSAFYFPNTFLNAVLQVHVRSHKIPFDTLHLGTKVLKEYRQLEQEYPVGISGVYVYGFYLEAASWSSEKGQLVEPHDGVMYDLMPLVHLEPRRKVVETKIDHFLCPVYKTSLRSGARESSSDHNAVNYVFNISLPCTSKAEHWVRRGTAIILQPSIAAAT